MQLALWFLLLVVFIYAIDRSENPVKTALVGVGAVAAAYLLAYLLSMLVPSHAGFIARVTGFLYVAAGMYAVLKHSRWTRGWG
jgi:hypothetical protein